MKTLFMILKPTSGEEAFVAAKSDEIRLQSITGREATSDFLHFSRMPIFQYRPLRAPTSPSNL